MYRFPANCAFFSGHQTGKFVARACHSRRTADLTYFRPASCLPLSNAAKLRTGAAIRNV
jgi:hypothetical protein